MHKPEIMCFAGPNYDNSGNNPMRIYKKKNSEEFIWENEFWSEKQIDKLVHG